MGRAMMCDGVIELRQIREAVEAAGYDGPIEVEIFNEAVWRSADDGLLELMQQRFLEHV
jgi:sugar phosphate isomerase/epimerase